MSKKRKKLQKRKEKIDVCANCGCHYLDLVDVICLKGPTLQLDGTKMEASFIGLYNVEAFEKTIGLFFFFF